MTDEIWWLVVGTVLVIAELFTGTFVLLMLGIGALAAGVAGLFGAPGGLMVVIFAVVSGASLLLLRPWINKKFGKGREMGLATIEGADVLVIEKVTRDSGMVKIEGELWRARPYDVDQTYEPGDRVRVVKVDGATALVWRD